MITSHFNFIHVPRTGGSTIQAIIKQSSLRVDDAVNHRPLIEMLNMNTVALPTFTVVRNPFDWYISWYEWLCQTSRFEGSFHGYMQKVATDHMLKIVPYSLFGTFSACWNYFVGPRPMDDELLHIVRFEQLSTHLPSLLNMLSDGKITVKEVEKGLNKTHLRSTQRTLVNYYDHEITAIVQHCDKYMLDVLRRDND